MFDGKDCLIFPIHDVDASCPAAARELMAARLLLNHDLSVADCSVT